MNKPQVDDFQAVRTVVETLEPFEPQERERIIRWAREKLGMSAPALIPHVAGVGAAATTVDAALRTESATRQTKDIKSFLLEKDPKSDRQLAAAVAFYYAFEAPTAERKDSIGTQDLIDACRKAGIRRPTNPGQTLRNTAHAGYLDKAAERGNYKLNAVGENLVAMVLPGGDREAAKVRGKKSAKRGKKKK